MLDAIVLSSILFAAIFSAAWWKSANLRAWIERPKYRFQSNLEGYDRTQVSNERDETEE